MTQELTRKEDTDMKSSGVTAIDSVPHRMHRNREKVQGSPLQFVVGQCTESFLLLLVMTAVAIAILATISILASTKDLIGGTSLSSTQSVELQNSGNEMLLPPQP